MLSAFCNRRFGDFFRVLLTLAFALPRGLGLDSEMNFLSSRNVSSLASTHSVFPPSPSYRTRKACPLFVVHREDRRGHEIVFGRGPRCFVFLGPFSSASSVFKASSMARSATSCRAAMSSSQTSEFKLPPSLFALRSNALSVKARIHCLSHLDRARNVPSFTLPFASGPRFCSL